MRLPFLSVLLCIAAGVAAQAPPRPLPVIDMHLHAMGAADQGPPPLAMCAPFPEFPVWNQRGPYLATFLDRVKRPRCPDPIWSPTTDAALLKETLETMERRNVYGVVAGSSKHVSAWMKAAPHRFIPAQTFNGGKWRTPAEMERLHRAGGYRVIGEVTTQYEGVDPTDPRMEPYFALAERLDVPVQLHVGTGPPGVIYLNSPGYRARLHSALTVEEVLVKHPKLRIYLAHAGYPMIDDLLALLYAHPQVHVDTGVIIFTQPRAAFYRYLQRIVEAGFANRVMFGSDQMVWPGVIERSIKVIEDAPFLSSQQKRDILYNNAARFLRLSEAEIARHHRR